MDDEHGGHRRPHIVGVHAAVVGRAQLIQERRELYRLVAELGAAQSGVPITDELLDSPVVRAAIGEVMSGSRAGLDGRLVTVPQLGGRQIRSNGHRIGLASAREASAALAPALREVGRQAGLDAPPVLLDERRPTELESAWSMLRDGIDLAHSLDPELLDDLLPHVELISVLVRSSCANLGSASSRDFPGLILLPAPSGPLEVAEGVVHEAAHQKLFDLAITRDLLGASAFDAAPHRPSWSDRAWPLEQLLAGWHAYCCLDQFNVALTAGLRDALRPGSLLPVAAGRARELGGVLLRYGHRLGADAHDLLESVTGVRPAAAPAMTSGPADDLEHRIAVGALTRRVISDGTRVLIGGGGCPPEIYWALPEARDAGVAT